MGLKALDTNHETVRARYVVGCDGGHSTVRQQLKMKLEGERTNKHFGVMDIVPLTNFRTSNPKCWYHLPGLTVCSGYP